MVAMVFNARIHTVSLLRNNTIVDLCFGRYEVLLTVTLIIWTPTSRCSIRNFLLNGAP